MRVSPGLERVLAALREKGVDTQVLEFPQGTRTAQEAAVAVGTSVGQIVKSLVFVAGEEPVLVLVSGAHLADVRKLEREFGAPVRRADAETVREATGFAIGGVAPVGHLRPLRTLIDENLLKYDVVYAAAGTPYAIFPIAPAELVRITGPSWCASRAAGWRMSSSTANAGVKRRRRRDPPRRWRRARWRALAPARRPRRPRARPCARRCWRRSRFDAGSPPLGGRAR